MDGLDQPRVPVTRILTELEKIQLEEFTDREFVEADIYMDGRRFVRCTFRQCRLFVKLGLFGAEHCSFDSCRWMLDGPAQIVGQMVQLQLQQKQ